MTSIVKKTVMAKIYSILLLLFWGAGLSAQEIWSLEKCIDHAQKNSLVIQQSELAISRNQISLKQAKSDRYPNLNGSLGFFEQFGRTIDPTTNSFANKKIGSSQMAISSGVILFNAGRINNTIAQAKLNLEAARQDAQNTSNDLSLNVALIYLQILFAEDQVENAKSKLSIAQAQLKRTQALIQAGSLAENEALQFDAQVATGEQSLITAQNTLDNAYLQLKQLLRLENDVDIQIERPDISTGDLNPELLTTEAIYQQALGNQPNIKAGEIRLKSSELGQKIARSQLYPSISLSGSLSTNYSTLSRKLDTENSKIASFPQAVKINGAPATLEVPQLVPSFIDNPFKDQFNENFGQSVGVRLSIPIYQNGRTSAAIQRAQLGILQTKLANEQAKQSLRSNIQKAIADAKAAKRQYTAAQKAAKATQAVYENTQQKYAIGAASSFELTTAKNNADTAKTQLTGSKYDLIFKLKIIDYYQGRKIQF